MPKEFCVCYLKQTSTYLGFSASFDLIYYTQQHVQLKAATGQDKFLIWLNRQVQTELTSRGTLDGSKKIQQNWFQVISRLREKTKIFDQKNEIEAWKNKKKWKFVRGKARFVGPTYSALSLRSSFHKKGPVTRSKSLTRVLYFDWICMTLLAKRILFCNRDISIMFLFRNPVIFWSYLAFLWSVGCVEFLLSQLAKSDLYFGRY